MLNKRTFIMSAVVCAAIVAGLFAARVFAWYQTLGFALFYTLLLATSNPWMHYLLFPELHRFPYRDRSGTLQSALFRHTFLTSLAIIVTAFGAIYAVFAYSRAFWQQVFPLLLAIAPVCMLIPNWAHRAAIRGTLRRRLRAFGVMLCVNCGYDLKGSLTSDRCPECGTPFADQPG